MKFLNLTQHQCTSEQAAEGLLGITGEDLNSLRQLLTFETLPTKQEIEHRARLIALLATRYSTIKNRVERAMIGGAPFLMSALEAALLDVGIEPFYAFSKRESFEETQLDGSVKKVNIFKHCGFVQV